MLLVDADPQGSPRDWHEQNGGEVLDVVGLDRETLARNLKVRIAARPSMLNLFACSPRWSQD